jgi:hypothetical protein
LFVLIGEEGLIPTMEKAYDKISLGSEREGHKRKLAETSLETLAPSDINIPLPRDIQIQVNKFNSSFSWREADCLVARQATHALGLGGRWERDIFHD